MRTRMKKECDENKNEERREKVRMEIALPVVF